MKEEAEFAVVWTVITLIRLLPLSIARRFADIVAYSVRDVFQIRKQIVDENLRRAFPKWGFARRSQVSKDCYRFFARAGVDWLKTERMLESETIRTVGKERLDNFSEEGSILVSGHLGFWELSAVIIGRWYGSLTVYADQQSNPYSQRLISRHREQMGVETTSGLSGVRELSKKATQGEFVGIIGDQRPRNQPEYVPFFGSLVQNTRILSFVARKSQKPVLPLAVRRSQPGELELKVYSPLPASLEEVTKDNRDRLLIQYNQWLEDRIVETPEQYFWLHKRWKNSRPVESGDVRNS